MNKAPSDIIVIGPNQVEKFLDSGDDSLLLIPDTHIDAEPFVFFLNTIQDKRIQQVGFEAPQDADKEFAELNQPGLSFVKTPKLEAITKNWINAEDSHSTRWSSLEFSHVSGDKKDYLQESSDLEYVHAITSLQNGDLGKPVVFYGLETQLYGDLF